MLAGIKTYDQAKARLDLDHLAPHQPAVCARASRQFLASRHFVIVVYDMEALF